MQGWSNCCLLKNYISFPSYHSTKTSPQLSQKKQVLYDFVEKQVKAGRVKGPLQPIKEYLKPEIQDMVRKINSDPAMRQHVYYLDGLAAKEGVEIDRLPPYHWQVTGHLNFFKHLLLSLVISTLLSFFGMI